MTDQVDAGATPADQGATPDATTTPADAAPATDADEPLGPAGKAALDDEREARREADRALRSARADLGTTRTALAAANARIAELEAANGTLETRVSDMTSAARDQRLRGAVTADAARRGFRDPEDAVTYLASAAVEYDGDGNPTNVGDLVEELAKTKPYLLTAGRLIGGPWGGAEGGANEPAGPSMTEMIRAAAGRST